MNAVDATRELLRVVDEVGEGVSVSWDGRKTEVRPDVQGGTVVGLTLVPEKVSVRLSFVARSSRVYVSLSASGADTESCLRSALSTLQTHLQLLRGGACPT